MAWICKKCGSGRRYRHRACFDCRRLRAINRVACSRCGATDRYASGGCKACTRATHRLNAANRKPCVTCGSPDRYVSGGCISCRKKKNASWRAAHGRSYQRIWERKKRDGLKERMFLALGKQCACCEETEEEFLTLDHVLRDGRADRGATGGTYMRMLVRADKAGWPKAKYRVLCMNCNWATRLGGACPHEAQVQKSALFLLSA